MVVGAAGRQNHPKQGQNAPRLSSITLPAVKEKDTLTLGIYNATGTLVKPILTRRFYLYKVSRRSAPAMALSAEKGHNRFLWDIRTESITPDVKNVFIYGDYSGYAVVPEITKPV